MPPGIIHMLCSVFIQLMLMLCFSFFIVFLFSNFYTRKNGNEELIMINKIRMKLYMWNWRWHMNRIENMQNSLIHSFGAMFRRNMKVLMKILLSTI